MLVVGTCIVVHAVVVKDYSPVVAVNRITVHIPHVCRADGVEVVFMSEDSGTDAEEVMGAELVGGFKTAEVIEYVRFCRASLFQQIEFCVFFVLYAAIVAGGLAPVVDTEPVVR